MAILEFPPVDQADEFGLLAAGGDLEPSSLLLAYSSGIFPWPYDEEYLLWFAPSERALLFLDEVRIPRSLEKERRRGRFEIRIDHDFESVIASCADLTNRTGQSGTWITPSMLEGYSEFHQAGYAHSIECYIENQLSGGMYGVAIKGMFAGESMFYRQPNASKLCLYYLIDYLRKRNVPWIDCQVMTPLLASFGARNVPRKHFMELLREALERPIQLFHAGGSDVW